MPVRPMEPADIRKQVVLEEHDLEPLARELQRGRRSAGARAHDRDIEHHDL